MMTRSDFHLQIPPATMAAAVVTAPRRLEVREVDVPDPAEGQVLVRLEGCGVCASNVPPWAGKPWFSYPMEPGALGHEGWGRIAAVGVGVTAFAPGERVAMLSGHAYAQYDVADAGAVVRLPTALDDEPFPAEPLGCALNIFRRSGVVAGCTVALVGLGFLGALLTQLVVAAGARVIALARREPALHMAQKAGAAYAVRMDDHTRVIDEVRTLTDGNFCDVVIESTGHQWPLDLAGELTRERGRLVVAGYHQDGPRQVNMQLWNWRGLDVINAHERDPRMYLAGMQEAVEAVCTGKLVPGPLYSHRFPLDQLGEALNLSEARPDGFTKALVLM
jgi:threonine dehydrogenase-like Zn-dependent dehydrogenase